MQRLIVGISGASGTIYGIRLLEVLRDTPIETHLVMSEAAKVVAGLETEYSVAQIEALADVVHPNDDLAACISSGSYLTMGMVVAPCAVKSLSAIAHSHNDNLLTRAADVVLKEATPSGAGGAGDARCISGTCDSWPKRRSTAP